MTVRIVLANDSERERATRDHLADLLRRYDLRRWQFTDVVCIDESATPHSHPTLTLNTNYLGDDARLLAVYLHEQLHWFCGEHETAVTQVTDELRVLYPEVPVGLPEGARSEFSSYLHLIIGWLEFAALAELIGRDEAWRVLEGWTVYTWVYDVVLQDSEVLGSAMNRYHLLP